MVLDGLRVVHTTTTNAMAQSATTTEALKELVTVVNVDRTASPNSTVRPENFSDFWRLPPLLFRSGRPTAG